MAGYEAEWRLWFPVLLDRKVELYEMGWSLKDGLRDCHVAAAPYGGPIAVLKESQRCSPSVRPQLDIYTASGMPVAAFPWKSGVVKQLGWTVGDDLLCVQEDGTVLVYDLFGSFKRHFSMGNELVQSHVLEAKVFHSPYGTGIALLSGTFRFILATNIEDLKLRRLPEVPGLQGAPSCWAVLSQDRQSKVLLAAGPDLYMLDTTACTPVVSDMAALLHVIVLSVCFLAKSSAASTDFVALGLTPQASSIVHMAVSFSYKYLAFFTDSGHVWMGSANLKDKLGEVETKMKTPPKQMAWCRRPKGQQPSVVVMWEKNLLVAGQCQETIQYPFVAACEEIFKIASMAPGALLLEANREYEKESQKADEYLREIKEQDLLGEAVKQCVEAAGYEHEPETQKMLLRAASFGKCFLSNFRPELFVHMCRDLRVLNAVRDYTVGIPLTLPQYPFMRRYVDPQKRVCKLYKQMTVQVLIDRLVHRKLYPLAFEICRYLKTPEYQGVSRVLKHWACCKVQQKEEADEVIARAISVKLGETAGISYSDIAAKAYECGRTELAIKLLEFEPRSGEQVPLLLKMKRSQLALSKAIESGDTDLVYTVVTYLKNEMNRGDFFMTLRNQPVALSLYRQFCKHQEPETLKDLFNQDDDHQELGNFYVRASYQEGATEEEIRLLRFQRRVEEEKGERVLGCSLHDTLHCLLTLGLHKQAEQLYKDFRVPDKRYWWLKLTALAEKEDWEELEKFAKSKKSPIGYLPFVEVCVKHLNKYEAKKYVSKVTPEQKVKAHLAVGDLEGAAEAAIERRSEGEVSLVLSRCSATTDRTVVDRLNRARAAAAKK
ncbi:vacuolar protein sorting-associated protein 16-like [Scleropages formosus]|uniref:Vacuolar protein sorting-associated protein 16 homolog n=1 Tax=Scleropages formosus TaxID=113540 RepID=A0A0P7UR54_SCLFO|nr:vacuolar protein sorting-associated protein 16-like [Scleropages formosus]